MKFISLFFLILFTFLNARDNPFEPTQTYQEEIARMMELEDGHPLKPVEEITENMMTMEDNITQEENMTSPMIVTPQEMQKEAMSQTSMNDNQIMQTKDEMMEKNTSTSDMKMMNDDKAMKEVVIKEPMEMKETKPMEYKLLTKDLHKLLPFLTVEFNNNAFEVKSKYKVFKKFNLENEHKIIVDFRADVNFYTKKNRLDSANFKQLIIGNHKKENYFRMVLIVEDNPNSYKVTYNDMGLRVEKP